MLAKKFKQNKNIGSLTLAKKLLFGYLQIWAGLSGGLPSGSPRLALAQTRSILIIKCQFAKFANLIICYKS